MVCDVFSSAEKGARQLLVWTPPQSMKHYQGWDQKIAEGLSNMSLDVTWSQVADGVRATKELQDIKLQNGDVGGRNQ